MSRQGVFLYQAKSEPIPPPPSVDAWGGGISQPLRKLVSAALVSTTLFAGPVFTPPPSADGWSGPASQPQQAPSRVAVTSTTLASGPVFVPPPVPFDWNQPQPTFVPNPRPTPTGESSAPPPVPLPSVDWMGQNPLPHRQRRLPWFDAFTSPNYVLPSVDWMGHTALPQRPSRSALWAPFGADFPYAAIISPGYPSLKAALFAFWDAKGLTPAVQVGPLRAELQVPGTPPPFANMWTIDTKPFRTFTKSYWVWHWIQFSIFGSGEADARARGENAMTILDTITDNPSVLALSFGNVAGCWNEVGEPQVSKLPSTGIAGGPTYQAILKYRFQVNRTRP